MDRGHDQNQDQGQIPNLKDSKTSLMLPTKEIIRYSLTTI